MSGKSLPHRAKTRQLSKTAPLLGEAVFRISGKSVGWPSDVAQAKPAAQAAKIGKGYAMTSSREIPKEGTCSLCGGQYDHYGNNPAPLGAFYARCCDWCNAAVVIPLRLRRIAKEHSSREDAR
jgi:hypothetical protein